MRAKGAAYRQQLWLREIHGRQGRPGRLVSDGEWLTTQRLIANRSRTPASVTGAFGFRRAAGSITGVSASDLPGIDPDRPRRICMAE